MSSAESTANKDTLSLDTVTFGGNPNEDVTLFLQRVKRIAIVEGRQRDKEWMVDYAESCLIGPALRWYHELEDSNLRSWKALRGAFLLRFDPPVDVPAAAKASPSCCQASPIPAKVWASTAPLPDSVPATSTNIHIRKILVIGDCGVGKSCIIERFLGHGWARCMMPTEGVDDQSWTGSFAGTIYKYHIWDTSGADDDGALLMRRPYYKEITRFWITYDVTDRRSFQSVRKWNQSIQLHKSATSQPKPQLFANKCDLSDKRVISEAEGRQIANELRLTYREMSAKTDFGISELRGKWVSSFAVVSGS
ncbi:GTP-binding protein [Tulasnella sp. JGI-2019a]|nr:GTP-binding protein [Tulasnella sp. JGI-2019a]